MSYNVDWKSGGTEGIPGKATIVLPERIVNTTSTSLTLTGKKTANYGEIQQENFIKLLENFASNTAPANPTIGQLWFSPVGKALYLCVETSTVEADTTVYFESGLIGWVRIWEATVLGALEEEIVTSITTHTSAADPHPQYSSLTGDEIISGTKTFSSAPEATSAVEPSFKAIKTGTGASTTSFYNSATGSGVKDSVSGSIIFKDKATGETSVGLINIDMLHANLNDVMNSTVYKTGEQTITGNKIFTGATGHTSPIEGQLYVQKTGTGASIATLYNAQDSFGISDSDYGSLLYKNKLNNTIVLGGTLNNPNMIGYVGAPTATPGTNNTQVATTAFVQNAVGGAVLLTGNQSIAGNKTFTGGVWAPTPSSASNDTTVATTAFVQTVVGIYTEAIPDIESVGSYAFCRVLSDSTITAGSAVLGSNLEYSGIYIDNAGNSGVPASVSPIGTWKAMGQTLGGYGRTMTLFIRIF